MKSPDSRHIYLIMGLRALCETALVSGAYKQPPTWQFPDFNVFRPSVGISDFEWMDEVSIIYKNNQEKMDLLPIADKVSSTAFEDFVGILTPLFCILGEDIDVCSFNSEKIDKVIVPAFLRLERKNVDLFDLVSAHGNASYRELIRRFNEQTWPKPVNFINVENLPTFIQRGFALYKQSGVTQIDLRKLIWGIALMGCGYYAMLETRKCSYCPRRTLPRSELCFEHSQAGVSFSGRTKSQQVVNNRNAKKALQIAKDKGLLDEENASIYGYQIGNRYMQFDESKSKEIAELEMRSLVAELMFPAYFNWNSISIWTLRHMLKQSPRVLKILGGDQFFNSTYIEMVDNIRKQLNLFCSDEGTLPYTVLAFEKWLECEELARPGIRGGGVLAEQRMVKAILLAKSGKSRKEIAEVLCVGLSTITLWTKKSKVLAEYLK